jgi:catechol 2,3-dioxygenase
MTARTEIVGANAHFRARRLGHANMYVGDLARSMAFYNEVAGLEETYRLHAIRAGFLSNGNTHHDVGLVELSGPTVRRKSVPGLNHFGFELENEVALVNGYRSATGKGVEFYRTVDHVIARSVYIFDPDGNSNEIYADVTKNWRTERGTTPTKKWIPGEPVPSPEPKYHPNPELRRVEGAVFHPLRVTHAVVVAADYEGLFRHYTDIVGLVPVAGGADGPFALLTGTCGYCNIGIFRARPGRPAGLHHIGFLLNEESDLDDARPKLQRLGLAPEREVDHPLRRSTFVRDPDGILVEFYVNRPGHPARLTEVDEETALFLA